MRRSDTTYTLYHGDPNLKTIAFGDTVFEYSIVMRRDTLWYQEGDDLRLMMLGKFSHGWQMDIELYVYPRLKQNIYRVLTDGRRTDYGFECYNNTFHVASFYKENGGLTFLKGHWGWAGITGEVEELIYELVNYIPGKPPEE